MSRLNHKLRNPLLVMCGMWIGYCLHSISQRLFAIRTDHFTVHPVSLRRSAIRTDHLRYKHRPAAWLMVLRAYTAFGEQEHGFGGIRLVARCPDGTSGANVAWSGVAETGWIHLTPKTNNAVGNFNGAGDSLPQTTTTVLVPRHHNVTPLSLIVVSLPNRNDRNTLRIQVVVC